MAMTGLGSVGEKCLKGMKTTIKEKVSRKRARTKMYKGSMHRVFLLG